MKNSWAVTKVGNDYSIVIGTCDKFSDLWQTHFELLFKNWAGEMPPIYLVTDKETTFSHEGVKVVVGNGHLPGRIKTALAFIESDRVLLTLDDYFVINPVNGEDIGSICAYAEENNVDYLMLYNRRWAKKRYYKGIDSFSKIDLEKRYAVTLYPAIWTKSFLDYCIDEELTPWMFEPMLTEKAKAYNANCVFSHAGSFEMLDVVRKGRVLHKAHKYFKKHGINIGDRPLAKRSTEMKLAFFDFIDWHTPRWFFRMTKKIAKLFGMKFFSED